jgi:hypothetical protein
MPAQVWRGLPAFWAKGKLVALPALGYGGVCPASGIRLRYAPGDTALGGGVAVPAMAG